MIIAIKCKGRIITADKNQIVLSACLFRKVNNPAIYNKVLINILWIE